MRSSPALILPVAALACSSLLAPSAAAQGKDRVAAEALFAEGRNLMKAGRVAEACSKLEASQKLDPAPGTLLNLGDCYEKAGRTASAWLAFRDAAAASTGGDQARIAHMRSRADALEPKLCRLRIDVDSSMKLPVMRDKDVVDESVYGQAVPVDPGTITISVREGERVHFLRTVDLTPSASGCEAKSVQIPAIASNPSPAPPAGPAPSADKPAEAALPDHDRARDAESEGTRTNVLPLVFAGAGIPTIGVGVLIGLSAKSTWDEAKSLCTPLGCGQPAQDKAADARTGAGIATVVVGAGAVLLAGGLLWFVLVPRAGRTSERTSGLHVVPTIQPNGGGVIAATRF